MSYQVDAIDIIHAITKTSLPTSVDKVTEQTKQLLKEIILALIADDPYQILAMYLNFVYLLRTDSNPFNAADVATVEENITSTFGYQAALVANSEVMLDVIKTYRKDGHHPVIDLLLGYYTYTKIGKKPSLFLHHFQNKYQSKNFVDYLNILVTHSALVNYTIITTALIKNYTESLVMHHHNRFDPLIPFIQYFDIELMTQYLMHGGNPEPVREFTERFDKPLQQFQCNGYVTQFLTPYVYLNYPLRSETIVRAITNYLGTTKSVIKYFKAHPSQLDLALIDAICRLKITHFNGQMVLKYRNLITQLLSMTDKIINDQSQLNNFPNLAEVLNEERLAQLKSSVYSYDIKQFKVLS